MTAEDGECWRSFAWAKILEGDDSCTSGVQDCFTGDTDVAILLVGTKMEVDLLEGRVVVVV